jgi:plasmid stabilization system protein ParE
LSYKLKIDIDALTDIQQAVEWYHLQSPGLGSRFKGQVKKQINGLKSNPLKFSVKYKSVRCCKVDKFPFLIHFYVDEKNKIVAIFAVFHTSRNPKIWSR